MGKLENREHYHILEIVKPVPEDPDSNTEQSGKCLFPFWLLLDVFCLRQDLTMSQLAWNLLPRQDWP